MKMSVWGIEKLSGVEWKHVVRYQKIGKESMSGSFKLLVGRMTKQHGLQKNMILMCKVFDPQPVAWMMLSGKTASARRWFHFLAWIGLQYISKITNLLAYFLLLFHLWTVSSKHKSAKAHKLFYCKLYDAREKQNYLNMISLNSNNFILPWRFHSNL